MIRIDETAAAKAYVAKLKAGGYPVERAKNNAVEYCKMKEARDTEAVRAFTKSALFDEFKQMKCEGGSKWIPRKKSGITSSI